jgi:hypothetical protein
MGTGAMLKTETKVITGKVRGSYVRVFEKSLNELNGKEEFSMSILIDKNDKETIGAVKNAMNNVCRAKWGGQIPPGLKSPLRDGDVEKPNDMNYAGHFWMNLKSSRKPGIVDRYNAAVTEPDAFMSGDYCRVAMSAYAYEKGGNKGVSFGLNNIMVLEKGEPLGTVTRAQDDFQAFADAGEVDPW